MKRLLAAAITVAALALAGCAGDDRELVVIFDDVLDLAPRSAVKIADVQVGTIRRITLDEDLAGRVELVVTADVDLPERVSARLRKTSLLGERFVELVPDDASGGSIEWGSTITETEVVADFEELVGSGSTLLAAVAADDLAAGIEAGAIGLGGRGETLDATLANLDLIVHTYTEHADDLLAAIDGFESFLADVGPESALHGEALTEVRRAVRALSEEDERLLDALADMRSLSRTGTDIITTHRDRMDATLADLTAITGELTRRRADLERLLPELTMHNRNAWSGVNNESAQIFADMLFCGWNETPGHPVRDCNNPPQGTPRPPVGEPQR